MGLIGPPPAGRVGCRVSPERVGVGVSWETAVARSQAAVIAAGVRLLGPERAPGRSSGRERSDAFERRHEVPLPEPAGGELERGAAGVAGEPAGEGEQAAPQRARGTDDAIGEPDQL